MNNIKRTNMMQGVIRAGVCLFMLSGTCVLSAQEADTTAVAVQTKVAPAKAKIVAPKYEMKQVSGHIFDAATKKPLAGVRVQALSNRFYTTMTDENGAYTSALDALQTGTYKLVETKAPEGYFINQYTDFEISNDAEANVTATNVTVKEMKIRTKALEKDSQKNVLDGSKTKQTIEDTMPYDHFVTAKEYTVKTTYAIKPAGKTDE